MGRVSFFSVISFNYRHLGLKERENVLSHTSDSSLCSLREKKYIQGFVLLKTCLRVELYICGENPSEFIKHLHINHTGYQFKKGEDALVHLFRVVCGMDSIIIGENQILSQIKKTFLQQMKNRWTCGELNVIFNHAISLGKKFRHLSHVSRYGVSLEQSIYRFLSGKTKNLPGKKILLIGTGEVCRGLLYVMGKKDITNITITTRNPGHLNKMNSRFGLTTIRFEEKYRAMNEADIIISATAAPHLVVVKDHFTRVVQNNHPRIILDLAVPRDVDPGIASLDSVDYYTIEDIYQLSNENMNRREEISREFEHLIHTQLAECRGWFLRREEYR